MPHRTMQWLMCHGYIVIVCGVRCDLEADEDTINCHDAHASPMEYHGNISRPTVRDGESVSWCRAVSSVFGV